MARSVYIYVVCHDNPYNPNPPHIIAAFTVKHELQTWLEKCDHQYKSEFSVWRVKDNSRKTYNAEMERIKL
jgi:hypothetical protein